jgi:hypothetical protein
VDVGRRIDKGHVSMSDVDEDIWQLSTDAWGILTQAQDTAAWAAKKRAEMLDKLKKTER